MTTYRQIHSYKMPIHFGAEGGASLHPSGTKFIAGGGRRGGSMALGAVEGGELGSDLKVYVFDFATGEELECHKGHHVRSFLCCFLFILMYINFTHCFSLTGSSTMFEISPRWEELRYWVGGWDY